MLLLGIASFGDTKINSDGQTGASMNGQSNLASANGVTGNIHSDGTANGGTKNMTVNNGLKVDENGENTRKYFNVYEASVCISRAVETNGGEMIQGAFMTTKNGYPRSTPL